MTKLEGFLMIEVFFQNLSFFQRNWNERFFFNSLKFEKKFLDFPEKTETNFYKL